MESKADRGEAGSIPGGCVGGLRKSPTRQEDVSEFYTCADDLVKSPASDTTLPEVLYTESEVAEKVNEALCKVALVYLERNDRI